LSLYIIITIWMHKKHGLLYANIIPPFNTFVKKIN
jgi:hypothetical protein